MLAGLLSLVVGPAIDSGARAGGPRVALVPDPAIQALMGEVSADSLRAWDETLVGFFTRNTMSDTTSSTVGIGAARRWVHGKFQQFSDQTGGALVPSYFDFSALICGLTRPHRNVLGTLPGVVDPDRLFMVGGHLDSRNVAVCDPAVVAPGANDDATGVLNALELARILSDQELEATVVFQAFTGEEQGLFGSTAYAAAAKGAGLEIIGMLNSDIIGNIDGCPDNPDCDGGLPTDMDSLSVRCFSGPPSTSSSRQLSRLARRVAEAYLPLITVRLIPLIDRPGRAGDHIPFYNQGFPAIRFIETLEYLGQQHNGEDLIQHMEFDYFAQNVKLNLALLANLALAPPTPEGLQVYDFGTGGMIRAQWSPLGGVADLAGYRVAYRYAETGDTLYYADVLDAGASTSLDIGGLANEVALEVSVSAYDIEGHESVYSSEVRVIPGITPRAPKGFGVASRTDRIRLSWRPNQELDLRTYRVHRSLNPNNGFAQIDSVPPETQSYEDFSAQAGTFYYYRITAVDHTDLESPPSSVDKGRLASHQFGIQLVDATRDGTGNLGNPTDAEVDTYYEAIFSGFPILDRWDWVVQFGQNGVLLTDADMGRYRAVFIHSDRTFGTIAADSSEIRQYLEGGGRVWIGGWEMRRSLGGGTVSPQTFLPGSFMYESIHVEALRTATSSENDFVSALPSQPEYPTLTVDAVKWPFFSGRLTSQDALVDEPLFPEQTVSIYTYNSSLGINGPNHGHVNALKYPVVSPKLFFTDVPLYFLNQAPVRALAIQVMHEFGFGATDVAESGASAQFQLQVQPNPFSQRADLRFYLPRASEVTLRVVDVQGRLVATLLHGGRQGPGWQNVAWDGVGSNRHNVSSGIYYSILEVEEVRLVRPLLRLR